MSSKLLDMYYFWCENWYTWRHIRIWSPYLYLAGFQDQPPAASKWPDIIFDVRIEILTLKNLQLDMHEGILEFDLHICTWLASRIILQRPPSGQLLFWYENWNPDPKKPIFRNAWRHFRVWPPYLYLAGLQDQPPAASMWPAIILMWELKSLP